MVSLRSFQKKPVDWPVEPIHTMWWGSLCKSAFQAGCRGFESRLPLFIGNRLSHTALGADWQNWSKVSNREGGFSVVQQGFKNSLPPTTRQSIYANVWQPAYVTHCALLHEGRYLRVTSFHLTSSSGWKCCGKQQKRASLRMLFSASFVLLRVSEGGKCFARACLTRLNVVSRLTAGWASPRHL